MAGMPTKHGTRRHLADGQEHNIPGGGTKQRIRVPSGFCCVIPGVAPLDRARFQRLSVDVRFGNVLCSCGGDEPFTLPAVLK